jgi:hypothetical protein
MPVRGSTAWQHARVDKRVINRDEGGDGRVTWSGTHYVICAWNTCENDGLENYKIRQNTAADGREPRYVNFVFCSERCKNHWLDELHRNKRAQEG